MKRLDKKALKKSFFASSSRLIGTVLAAGSGALIHQLVGGGLNGWGTASFMALVSFFCIWFAEYEREVE